MSDDQAPEPTLLQILTQIPRKKLVKGAWYLGKGRNGDIGMWDGEDFLVIGQNSYPVEPRKWVNQWAIKREPYFEAEDGCFQPFKRVPMGQIVEPHADALSYAETMGFPVDVA
ncbi:hypothetical protein ACFIQF_18555 [Comamonas sp. J-3]|uniref:hypothetical protein n=1 Tax=Comamonas trifloxystrobinivorans TaxID=3350256 RepID=UPI00372BB366